MKIKTESLRSAFAFVSRASAKATTIDILKCVQLVAKDGKFTLACNNLHMYAEAYGECGAGEISCCVNADKIGHALNSAGEEVDLKLEKLLTWKSGKSRYTMGVLLATDFPGPKRGGDPIAVIIDPEIVEHITRVSFACAAKGPKFHTHGVGLEAKGGDLTATATDDHKLATVAIGRGPYPDFSVIIHRDVVSALASDPQEAHVFGPRIEFIYSNGLIVANLIEAQFPDWRRVMQMKADESIRISRAALLGAIKAALPFDELASVHLVMKENTLHVEGADHDNTAQHTVDATGPDLDVWFMSSVLTPSLQAVKTDELALDFAKDAHGRRMLLIEDGALRCVTAPFGR